MSDEQYITTFYESYLSMPGSQPYTLPIKQGNVYNPLAHFQYRHQNLH